MLNRKVLPVHERINLKGATSTPKIPINVHAEIDGNDALQVVSASPGHQRQNKEAKLK